MSLRAPVTAVRLGGRPDLPLLILGPALGTTAQALWTAAAAHLREDFQVVAWDLPGHGTNLTPLEEPFTMAGLAAGVLEVVDTMSGGLQPPTFHYAGVDVGGAVSLQLLLDAPGRVESATLLATGAGSLAPTHEAPDALGSAAEGSAEGYAAVCGALAGFDVRRRLGRIAAPVLAVAGADDETTTPESLREIADGVRAGRLVVVKAAGRLAPVDAPAEVARLVREHALGPPATTVDDLGRDLRAVVGGHPHGTDGAPALLDERSLSLVTLTALVASGRHEALVGEVHTALERGVGVEEIAELLLQTARLCGVPVAEAALDTVRSALVEGTEG